MMVGPRRPTLLETGTRADGDSKSEFSAGTTREPLHKSTTPHPALRATLSRWGMDGVVRALSLGEKVAEGRMRGGAHVPFRMFMTSAEVPSRLASRAEELTSPHLPSRAVTLCAPLRRHDHHRRLGAADDGAFDVAHGGVNEDGVGVDAMGVTDDLPLDIVALQENLLALDVCQAGGDSAGAGIGRLAAGTIADDDQVYFAVLMRGNSASKRRGGHRGLPGVNGNDQLAHLAAVLCAVTNREHRGGRVAQDTQGGRADEQARDMVPGMCGDYDEIGLLISGGPMN